MTLSILILHVYIESKLNLPFIPFPQMRKIIPFFSVMRSLHRFLTGDSSAPVNQNKADVDQRLMEFLIISGDAKVTYDIREPTIGE